MTDDEQHVRRFHGVIVPLVTPLTDGDTLDEAGLARLIEHVIAGGVHGIFVLGTTGEGPGLSYRLRRELVALACEMVEGRLPVLVGVTDTAFAESVDLSLVAADAGAAAAVLAPPFYVPPSQRELIGYVERMAGEVPLPLMLYNMPKFTKIAFDLSTLQTLCQVENIAGIKDSGGDLDYFARLIGLRRRRPDWSILIGPEHLLADAMRLGGDGGVNGGANVFPELFVDCYEAARDGRRTDELGGRIDDFQRIYRIGDDPAAFIKATKCALSILGICADVMGDPFDRFEARKREQVAQFLDVFRRAAPRGK